MRQVARRVRFIPKGVSGIAIAAALSSAAPSWAQTAQPSAQGGSDQSTAVDPTADEETPSAEIVVTGEKQNRSVQDTPTSVRVFTADDIDRQNLVSVYDALDRTANLAVSSDNNNSGFSIRGIANDNVTGAGTGDLATIYLDGSPLPREALSGPLDLWDLAAVEILRGPQSTLQGRNALAGAIILRTADPTMEWTGKARVILTGKGDERRFAAAVGGPIVADQIAVRLAGEHSRQDGFIFNDTLNIEEGFSKGDNLRAKVLFTPTAAPDFRLLVSYLHDRHTQGQTFAFTDTPDAFNNRIISGNRPTLSRTASDIVTVDGSYELSSALTLNSVSTWARIKTATVYDGDNLPVDQTFGDFSSDQDIKTQEVRLNVSLPTFDGLIGGYYSHLSNPDARFSTTLAVNPALLGVPAAVVGFYPNPLVFRSAQAIPQKVTNFAIFGDATWEVVPRLKLRGGFRWDSERQSRASTATTSIVTPLPDPAAAGPFAPFVTAVNNAINGQVAANNASSPFAPSKFDAFLPKVGLTYELTDDASLSATVQRGYRSGGSGANQGRARLYTFRPEYTWNYELALRTEWLDRRLTVNGNAFYIDWKNQQVSVQLSPTNPFDVETVNAGSSRVWGLELETRFQSSQELSFYGSAGYTNTRFKDFVVSGTATQNLAGQEFPNAPHWTLAAGATWQSERGPFADLNVNHRSSARQNITLASVPPLAERTLVNAKIGWRFENFGAYLTATNLFNEKYFSRSFLNVREQAIYGEPRVIGVTLDARF